MVLETCKETNVKSEKLITDQMRQYVQIFVNYNYGGIERKINRWNLEIHLFKLINDSKVEKLIDLL